MRRCLLLTSSILDSFIAKTYESDPRLAAGLSVHPENAQLHNVKSSYKTSSYQTPSCKTSRIQNVQDTNVQDTIVQDTNVQVTNFQNTKRLLFVNFKTCFKKLFCIFLP
jgi:hypothetical protein